jgi:hypothetical protein
VKEAVLPGVATSSAKKHRTELDSGRLERELKKKDAGWRLKEAEEVRRRRRG